MHLFISVSCSLLFSDQSEKLWDPRTARRGKKAQSDPQPRCSCAVQPSQRDDVDSKSLPAAGACPRCPKDGSAAPVAAQDGVEVDPRLAWPLCPSSWARRLARRTRGRAGCGGTGRRTGGRAARRSHTHSTGQGRDGGTPSASSPARRNGVPRDGGAPAGREAGGERQRGCVKGGFRRGACVCLCLGVSSATGSRVPEGHNSACAEG